MNQLGVVKPPENFRRAHASAKSDQPQSRRFVGGNSPEPAHSEPSRQTFQKNKLTDHDSPSPKRLENDSIHYEQNPPESEGKSGEEGLNVLGRDGQGGDWKDLLLVPNPTNCQVFAKCVDRPGPCVRDCAGQRRR